MPAAVLRWIDSQTLMKSPTAILDPANFRTTVESFNALDREEDIVNLIPNRQAFDWIAANVPLFECADSAMQEMYYFRWWTFRKHIKQTPFGIIITEFISPVKHAGTFNSISCALGHHLAEGRWIRDERYLDEYLKFWFRNENGKPEYRFHRYSQWVTDAALKRSFVTGHDAVLVDLLDDFIADYELWETEKGLSNGLFFQFDVWDGMEESISGSRKHKNARPTINSYMYANALAIAQIATRANRPEVATRFSDKAKRLKQLVQSTLWDEDAKFFKAQTLEEHLSSAREAIGFIPWCFNLPDAGKEEAWKQLIDPQGFWAPMGLTTAERRHPQFRSHGVGKCEWDGAAWPFATSQTLDGLANILRNYSQSHVNHTHYWQAMQIYTRCQQMNGKPYIGEYLDEVTGEWLKGDNPRSRFYNHSTYNDLIIAGLVGIVPNASNQLTLSPLLPAEAMDWFCLDGVRYHGHDLTIAWDRRGERYPHRTGLNVLIDGTHALHQPDLAPISLELK